MKFKASNIRSFIGAKDFDESRTFYNELGFTEVVIDSRMSLFRVNDQLGFYLQRAYVKDWVDNTMLFLEVEDVEACTSELISKGLQHKYSLVRFSDVKTFDYGRELFMHDPSGVLWHFCEFNKENKSTE